MSLFKKHELFWLVHFTQGIFGNDPLANYQFHNPSNPQQPNPSSNPTFSTHARTRNVLIISRISGHSRGRTMADLMGIWWWDHPLEPSGMDPEIFSHVFAIKGSNCWSLFGEIYYLGYWGKLNSLDWETVFNQLVYIMRWYRVIFSGSLSTWSWPRFHSVYSGENNEKIWSLEWDCTCVMTICMGILILINTV